MKPQRNVKILFPILILLVMIFSLSTLYAEEGTEKADTATEHVCTVCAANGNPMKVESLDLWSLYKAEKHYFCNETCKTKFDEDPEAYMPSVLPRPLPKFTVQDLKGKDATLEKYKGKVMLLDFWATWCKPCVEAIPDLKTLHEELGKDGKFTLIGISVDVGVDAVKKVKKFVKKQKIAYPIFRDAKQGQASLALKVTAIPAMFLVDQEGQIVAQWVGEVDKKEVGKKIEELLAHKE